MLAQRLYSLFIQGCVRYGGPCSFTNGPSGTVVKSSASGTANFQSFDNKGTLFVQYGTLGTTSFTNESTGTLHLELRGDTVPGTDFGVVTANTARLAGTIDVTTASFTPPAGSAYPFLTCNSGGLSGKFSSVKSPPSVPMSVSYGPTVATLETR